MKKIYGVILVLLLMIGCDTGYNKNPEEKVKTSQNANKTKPVKKADKVMYTMVCGKDGINIRTGPGTNYSKDETGKTMSGEKFYVLEEKNGWIKFRVTPTDVGWTGWVLKSLVEKKQKKKTKTYTTKRSDELQVLYDSGLLKKFEIDYNKAWVEPYLWNSLDYNTRVGIGITLAKICDKAGSTGRITFYNNNTGKKLAKYSQSFGYKSY